MPKRFSYSSRRIVAPATINSLVDNSAGVVNDTLQAIPDSGGALITDLITGLNTNVLPALRNNVADLGGKVNEILVILRSQGLSK